MPIYTVMATHYIFTTQEIEAATPSDAIDNMDATVRLCHQCSYDTSDPIKVEVYDSESNLLLEERM